MLVKNILTTVAIAALVAAAPAEDIEERRDPAPLCPGTRPDNSWCCKSTVPFGFLFFQGVGSKCINVPHNQKCPGGTTVLCCKDNQIAVSSGQLVDDYGLSLPRHAERWQCGLH